MCVCCCRLLFFAPSLSLIDFSGSIDWIFSLWRLLGRLSCNERNKRKKKVRKRKEKSLEKKKRTSRARFFSFFFFVFFFWCLDTDDIDFVGFLFCFVLLFFFFLLFLFSFFFSPLPIGLVENEKTVDQSIKRRSRTHAKGGAKRREEIKKRGWRRGWVALGVVVVGGREGLEINENQSERNDEVRNKRNATKRNNNKKRTRDEYASRSHRCAGGDQSITPSSANRRSPSNTNRHYEYKTNKKKKQLGKTRYNASRGVAVSWRRLTQSHSSRALQVTEFYRVLPSFTEFYRVLPSLNAEPSYFAATMAPSFGRNETVGPGFFFFFFLFFLVVISVDFSLFCCCCCRRFLILRSGCCWPAPTFPPPTHPLTTHHPRYLLCRDMAEDMQIRCKLGGALFFF